MSNVFINMRKLAIIFFFMSTSLFPQGWNNIIQTNIPFNGLSLLDLCSNKNGNNILVNYINPPTGYLKYYLFNTSGSVVRSHTFENQEVEFASIDGNNDKVYVVYKLGNTIKTRKSTNGGISWTNMQDINIGDNACNNIDMGWGIDDNALHVVWATLDEYPYFKTYYQRLYNDQWGPKENVTDGSYVGGFPTVSKSNNRVHVSYNTGFSQYPLSNVGDAKSRDKYNTTWHTPQLVWSTNSKVERIHAGRDKLFDFYYEDLSWYCNLLVKERNFNDTYWSSPEILDYIADPEEIVSAANTYDGKSHIVYIIGGGVGYRSYDNENWSSESSILNTYYSPRISSVSNDLFVVAGSSNYVFFLQYDAAPLAPKGLTLINNNGHPRLVWTGNSEPDMDYYTIYRDLNSGLGYLPIATTSNLLYDDPDVTINPPGGPAGHEVYYKITATDITSYQSGFSNTVRCNVPGNDPHKIISGGFSADILDYELEQNYPNPFNPTTGIKYQLKEKGFVSLRVYDMIGKEVAVLVNETQVTGQHSVTFNAANLPSGVYIYSLRVNGFVQNNKMILMK